MAERPEQSTSLHLDTETSDITMLAFWKIAQSQYDATVNTNLPTFRERRAFSYSRHSHGPVPLHPLSSSGRTPQLDTSPFPPQRQLSSPLDNAPSPGLVLSPTSPTAEPLDRSLVAALEAITDQSQESRRRPRSYSTPAFEQHSAERMEVC